MLDWERGVQQLEDNYEKGRKKNLLILQKKKESINKFKEKCSQMDQQDASLMKLLSGMIKDYDSRNEIALQEDKFFYEDISEHEIKYYQIILNWLQPIMKEVNEMLSQLNDFFETSSQHVNDIIRINKRVGKCKTSQNASSDPESCREDDKSVSDIDPRISQQRSCKTVGKPERDIERAHSPYSIALSPKLVSKLTGRPPLPVQRNNPKQSQHMFSTRDAAFHDTIINRNDTKCFNTSEVQGKFTSPGFFKFSEQKETENVKQIIFSCKSKQSDENSIKQKEHDIFDSLTESQSSTCHSMLRPNLPYPVFVSDFSQEKLSHSSDSEEKKLKSITSEKSVSTKSSSIAPVFICSRPKTPPLKTIADQTAKAALIRTMITERLNSCSPVNFSS